MARRIYLMKAYEAKGTEDIVGWWVSEKLDGIRCFWDGGISRGLPCSEVPYANPTSKLKATGLWTFYGNPIQAPDWFINKLPCCALDGELWAGRGNFQVVSSTVRKHTPVDAEWERISYEVFGSPWLGSFFSDGEVNEKSLKLTFDAEKCVKFFLEHAEEDYCGVTVGGDFNDELSFLEHAVGLSEVCVMVRQTRVTSWEQVEALAAEVVAGGGEGAMVRDGQSSWTPKRVRTILKCKPVKDHEGTVIGATSGKGKHSGKLGALILVTTIEGKTVELRLSGFTDEERELKSPPLGKDGDYIHPHSLVHFSPGDTVTYKYRELTKDGVPREARYFRKRDDDV